MRLHVRALLVALAFVACASGARAQDYSAVVVFGDSLSDSGNVAQALAAGVAAGKQLHHQPRPGLGRDPGGQTFDAPGINCTSGARGTNYAIGGACVNPDLTPAILVTVPGVGEIRLPGIDEQIALHVALAAQMVRPIPTPSTPYGPGATTSLRYPRGRPDACDPGCSAGQSRGRHCGDGAELCTHARFNVSRMRAHAISWSSTCRIAGATPFAQSIPDPRISATLTALDPRVTTRRSTRGSARSTTGSSRSTHIGLFDQVASGPREIWLHQCRRGTACAPAGSGCVGQLRIACGPAGSPVRPPPTRRVPTRVSCLPTASTPAARRMRCSRAW